MIRIVIADDQKLFAENLKIMLEAMTDDIKIVDIASDGDQAITMVDNDQPDLVLMDIRMPKKDGVAATREILKKNPDQKILIITSFQEEKYASQTLKYGAIGYLLKNMQPQNLIAAIRAANEGMVLLSDATATQLFKASNLQENDDILLWYKEVYISMNSREREVLQLMIDGQTNKQIASSLYLSEPTIRNYISSIYSKFNSSNRMEVIEHGRKILGYFSDDAIED